MQNGGGGGTVVLLARAVLDVGGVLHVLELLGRHARLLHLAAPPLRATPRWVSACLGMRVVERLGDCLLNGGVCLAIRLALLPAGLLPLQAANLAAPSQRRARDHCRHPREWASRPQPLQRMCKVVRHAALTLRPRNL